MKKRKSIVCILILMLIFGIFFWISSNAMAIEEDIEEDIYEKGQLRCPLDYENCQEEKDATGKVKSVTVTYTEKFDDGTEVTIDKIVKKTGTLGTYSVQFRVRGTGEFEKESQGRVNVVVLFDKSKTMSSKKKAKDAIATFSENLTNGNDNFYIALVQFAKTATKQKNVKFQNTPIKSASISGDFGISSHLEKALKRAYNALATVEGRKYIIVFGDGRYYLDYKNEDVCKGDGNGGEKNNCTTRWRQSVHGTDSVEYYLNLLDSAGVVRFGVHYNGSKSGSYSEIVKKKNNYVQGCDELKYRDCDNVYMGIVANAGIADAADTGNFVDRFNDILGAIKADVEKNTVRIEGELSDLIGSDFFMSDDASDTLRIQNFYIEKINSTGYTTPSFNVDIDPTTSTGWHKVNESYTLKVKTDTGEKTITVTDNPEVYWKSDSLDIHSCSGEATHDTEEIYRDDYPYYSKICSEGYLNNNGEYVEGYKTRITIDNAQDGQKSFALTNGRGFPTSVKLSTNIKCTYTFNVDDYNNDYKSIQDSINNYRSELSDPDIPEDSEALEDLKEANKDNPDYVSPSTTKTDIKKSIADLEVKLRELRQVLTAYKNLTDTSDIQDYEDRFNDQPAIVKVTYEDGSYDTLDLDTLKLNNGDMKVSSKQAVSVNGSNDAISPETTVTLHLEKEMGLSETCLNMTNSEHEECTLASYQLLSGGNKFYVDLEKTEGSVSVFVTSAGYYGNYDFKLDRDEVGNPACEFSNSIDRLEFRQIELNDPFLKEIDSKRGVGKNYLNNNFNFEKIIHGDTWNSKYEPEYYYLMSKTNVAKIKSDTSSDPSGSYLGQSCYFTNNNKWYCHFTRNELEGGSDNGTNWFYQFKAYDGIN